MSSPKVIESLGFKVYSDDLALIPVEGDKCRVLNTISPNSYGVAQKDPVFENALKTSDYLVLDGVYFALAPVLLEGKNIQRNQGPDVFYHFMDRLNKKGGKAFFLGSSEATLALISERAEKEYSGIKVATYSPPFKPEFSDEDNAAMIDAVTAFAPDILFVGMTCPKQEKWSIQQRENLPPCLVICIGNVFDWFAGTQKIIHPIWFKLRLGWFIRIFLRPEVFRRNIGNQMKFFSDVLLIFLRLKKNG